MNSAVTASARTPRSVSSGRSSSEPASSLERSSSSVASVCSRATWSRIWVRNASRSASSRSSSWSSSTNPPREKIGVRSSCDAVARSEEHTSELQSRQYLVCRLLLEKKNNIREANQTNCQHHTIMSIKDLFRINFKSKIKVFYWTSTKEPASFSLTRLKPRSKEHTPE